VAVASAGPSVCTLLQTDNHASNPPLSFLQAGCPSCRQTNSVRALKEITLGKKTIKQKPKGALKRSSLSVSYEYLCFTGIQVHKAVLISDNDVPQTGITTNVE